MSVIYYNATELADAALACTEGACYTHDSERRLEAVVESLAAYSVANVAAVNASYREAREPHTAAEILAEARKSGATLDVPRRRAHGRRVAQGLSYNAVAQNGRDYLEEYPEAARGAVHVLTEVLNLVSED